jgi:hypothetical protein
MILKNLGIPLMQLVPLMANMLTYKHCQTLDYFSLIMKIYFYHSYGWMPGIVLLLLICDNMYLTAMVGFSKKVIYENLLSKIKLKPDTKPIKKL